MSIIINIENWDSCKKTAYASTWDDFCIESWKKLVNYANQKKIPLTFFINTCGYCEAGRFQKDNDSITSKTPMDREDIHFYQKIVQEGHEIGGHTTKHYDMRNMNDSEIKKDCQTWISIMEKEKIIKKNQGLSFAYPYGYRPKSLKMIEKYFLGARSTMSGLNDFNPKNMYRLKSINLGKMTKIEKLNKALDDAIKNKQIIIESGHGINKECWSPISENIIYQHYDYVEKKQNILWCTTMVNIIKYIIQKNNLELVLKHTDKKKIIFQIKKHIDFNFDIIPITISFKISNNKIKKCIQCNKNICINRIMNYFFIKIKDFDNDITIFF